MRVALWAGAGVLFLVGMYFTALPGTLPAGRDDEGGIAGTYVVNGESASGVEYSGIVVIRRGSLDDAVSFDDFDSLGHDDLYQVQWTITGSIDSGFGFVDGDELSLVWETQDTAGPASRGTGTYTIHPDGGITGTRTVEGADGRASERLFPSQ